MGQLRCDLFADYTRARAPYLAASESNHGDASDEGVRVASLYDDRLADCRIWNTPKCVLTPIFKDQPDRFAKIRASLIGSFPLPIRTGDLWTIRDEPFLVALDDRCELVMHDAEILLPLSNETAKQSGVTPKGVRQGVKVPRVGTTLTDHSCRLIQRVVETVQYDPSSGITPE